jgi:phage/conjugal plasmid C-4 type zinc finger TraR family protein
MSDFGDDLDRANDLAARERDAGVARLQATLRSLTMAVGGDPDATECSDCGDDIGAARKAVAPWATRCIACQQQFERGRG